ncbi:MAG: helix-turn-helix domain-containing protein [Mycoplasmataceae bacterium]|jgi:transcriptional regulator with XRE-family HTH domain|nr:helix-turn-helix domain-containing protein [Mycoplasmataceae bacterium]
MKISNAVQISMYITMERKKQHITQQEIARKLNISFKKYNEFENNKTFLKINELILIMKILNIPFAMGEN